jgi:hypothetical protein
MVGRSWDSLQWGLIRLYTPRSGGRHPEAEPDSSVIEDGEYRQTRPPRVPRTHWNVTAEELLGYAIVA